MEYVSICIIHVVANAKDKVSGFNSIGRYNHRVLEFILCMICSVLTFQVVYIVCILSKLTTSAFSYSYGSVFKLKMVDITVRCNTSSHIHVDEYLISEVLLTKDSSTKLLPI